MASRIVLFDFDGVISDSLHSGMDIVRGLIPGLTIGEYRQLHEGNVVEGIAARTGFPVEVQKEFFTRTYAPAVAGFDIFTGMAEAIQALSRDHTLLVVSSTHSRSIDGHLARHNIRGFFEEILGVDVHPSKSEKVRRILAARDVLPKNCLFITDTLGDLREAAEVGVLGIGVTWGYHDRALLKKGKPYAIVDTPKELVESVAGYFREAHPE